jgi:hypothetical protein
VGGLRFKANPGKEFTRPHLQNNQIIGGVAQIIMWPEFKRESHKKKKEITLIQISSALNRKISFPF